MVQHSRNTVGTTTRSASARRLCPVVAVALVALAAGPTFAASARALPDPPPSGVTQVVSMQETLEELAALERTARSSSERRMLHSEAVHLRHGHHDW
ncbi:MAG: hypothetical protein ABIS35_05015 [Terracoccus sp.]